MLLCRRTTGRAQPCRLWRAGKLLLRRTSRASAWIHRTQRWHKPFSMPSTRPVRSMQQHTRAANQCASSSAADCTLRIVPASSCQCTVCLQASCLAEPLEAIPMCSSAADDIHYGVPGCERRPHHPRRMCGALPRWLFGMPCVLH